MAQEEEKLKLGKGAAFVKSRLERLCQEDVTWEADFRALPKSMGQSLTHYRGMLVTQADGSLLADSHVEGRPTVNDMATLLAHAMRRPLTGKAHRATTVHVRGHPRWRELFAHLAEIGIEVTVKQELPRIKNIPSASPQPLSCGQEGRQVDSAGAICVSGHSAKREKATSTSVGVAFSEKDGQRDEAGVWRTITVAVSYSPPGPGLP